MVAGMTSTTWRPRSRCSGGCSAGCSFEAGLNPFNNPPHLVLPFVPAGAPAAAPELPASGASSSSACSTWLGWRLLTQVANGWRPAERVLMIVALLAMPPLGSHASSRERLSLLVTVAMLEAFIALRAGRERAAAVWLVVVSLKPQVAVAIGAAVRRAGAAGGSSAWGLGLLAGTRDRWRPS